MEGVEEHPGVSSCGPTKHTLNGIARNSKGRGCACDSSKATMAYLYIVWKERNTALYCGENPSEASVWNSIKSWVQDRLLGVKDLYKRTVNRRTKAAALTAGNHEQQPEEKIVSVMDAPGGFIFSKTILCHRFRVICADVLKDD